MKYYEARPRLVALMTVAAAFATWSGRGATLSLTAFDVALPMVWLVAPLAAAGAMVLAAHLLRRRAPGHRAAAYVDPNLSDHTHPVNDAEADAKAASEAAADAAAPDPEVQLEAAQDEFVLELDAQSRVRGCTGAGAAALTDDPDALNGVSLLELVPGRIRTSLVDAVRTARATPGESVQLPRLRLNKLVHGKPPEPAEPLELTFAARADGSMSIRGRVIVATVQTGEPSDDRFSRIFHFSPDAILIVRYRDGTLLDFNRSFTRLLGYSREEAIGQRTEDLDLWQDHAAREALIERFRRERRITDAEATLKSATGAAVHVEVSFRLIELAGELHVLIVARDISKRLEAELAARSSEEKFTRVFTQSPDGVLILRSRDLTIADANPAFLRGCGFEAECLAGKPLSVLESVTHPREIERLVQLLKEDGRVANRELHMRSLHGRDMTVLISGAACDVDGEHHLMCFIKDVTELRHAQEQLRRSEERFRGAFENAPIGIMLLDPQGHIFQANRFATELLRYPERGLDSMHVSRLVPPDERGELKEQLERLVRGNELTVRSERRMLCADGLEIWTNCHVVLQQASDGEPLYSIMQIADITEMKTSQQRMERLAFYDTLTELANRRLFNDRLQQAVEHCRRHDVKAALLYLDLDQFKRVNDTLGHESGDVLLKEVASRLLGCVRREDTVGRPGGDEFTILLYDVEAASHAGKVAEKILEELERPLVVSGHQLVVTTSIGITVIPDDGTEPNALTRNADLAMYRAKEKGRNNYQFFSEELNTNAVHRLRTEYELRRALERSEFELYFQPMVRLSDTAIVGAECLLRWNHPERGVVGPDEFIGIAEETGAIVEIGNWVIEEACAAGRLMADQHGAPMSVAVNISPRQFRDPNLVATIRQSLRRAHLDPALLEVEITETMLMGDVEGAAEIVQRLHDLGIGLAIDDFGTGYSSLNYLKKFPISTVKVDRTFVTDIPASSDDMEITAAVIAMAHRLRMQVVAEGVETRAQLDFLREQSCDFAQGYLFGRGMPLKNFTRLIRRDDTLASAGG